MSERAVAIVAGCSEGFAQGVLPAVGEIVTGMTDKLAGVVDDWLAVEALQQLEAMLAAEVGAERAQQLIDSALTNRLGKMLAAEVAEVLETKPSDG